MYNFV